jgi:hypothetical protein
VPGSTEAACSATPSSQALLDQLEPFPANVQSTRCDLLAYNTGYRLLVADLDALPVEDRNVVWLTFTHPAWRRALVDWDRGPGGRAVPGRLRRARGRPGVALVAGPARAGLAGVRAALAAS